VLHKKSTAQTIWCRKARLLLNNKIETACNKVVVKYKVITSHAISYKKSVSLIPESKTQQTNNRQFYTQQIGHCKIFSRIYSNVQAVKLKQWFAFL